MWLGIACMIAAAITDQRSFCCHVSGAVRCLMRSRGRGSRAQARLSAQRPERTVGAGERRGRGPRRAQDGSQETGSVNPSQRH